MLQWSSLLKLLQTRDLLTKLLGVFKGQADFANSSSDLLVLRLLLQSGAHAPNRGWKAVIVDKY